MQESGKLPLLKWAQELQALSQTGLAYSKSAYDTERYKRVAEIAAEIASSAGAGAREQILGAFLAQQGYATPKVDVRGAALREGRILLVRERSDGKWCLPGGWADVGETPSEACAREVREESGIEVVPRKIVGVYDANRSSGPLPLFHAYKIIFLCDVAGGEPRGSVETEDAAFFSFEDIPPLSSPRTDLRHLEEIRAHVQNPQRQAAFD